MNYDMKLGVLSIAALVASVVVAVTVLFSEPDDSTPAACAADRELISSTQKAEAFQIEEGSNIPFHWMCENLVKVTRRIR